MLQHEEYLEIVSIEIVHILKINRDKCLLSYRYIVKLASI